MEAAFAFSIKLVNFAKVFFFSVLAPGPTLNSYGAGHVRGPGAGLRPAGSHTVHSSPLQPKSVTGMKLRAGFSPKTCSPHCVNQQGVWAVKVPLKKTNSGLRCVVSSSGCSNLIPTRSQVGSASGDPLPCPPVLSAGSQTQLRIPSQVFAPCTHGIVSTA